MAFDTFFIKFIYQFRFCYTRTLFSFFFFTNNDTPRCAYFWGNFFGYHFFYFALCIYIWIVVNWIINRMVHNFQFMFCEVCNSNRNNQFNINTKRIKNVLNATWIASVILFEFKLQFNCVDIISSRIYLHIYDFYCNRHNMSEI